MATQTDPLWDEAQAGPGMLEGRQEGDDYGPRMAAGVYDEGLDETERREIRCGGPTRGTCRSREGYRQVLATSCRAYGTGQNNIWVNVVNPSDDDDQNDEAIHTTPWLDTCPPPAWLQMFDC
jgi:hypothetical protein